MQIYLLEKGEQSGPYTSIQFEAMRRQGLIRTGMHYWCEGMTEWEALKPKRNLEAVSPISKTAFMPFEQPPPPRPASVDWGRRLMLFASLVLAALGSCAFLLAVDNPYPPDQGGGEASTAARTYASTIPGGQAYPLEEWPAAAAALEINTKQKVNEVFGAPNLSLNDGCKWIYFDRVMIASGSSTRDLAVCFDKDGNLRAFAPYPAN